MKAILIAGGRGERLKPITNKIPKPMVEIADKPILLHAIEMLKKHGITEFILALCYLPEVITKYFGDGKKLGVSISYSFEDPNFPLGTAGAVSLAKDKIKDTFIVTYADILRELDITAMIRQHKKNQALATINVYKRISENAKSKIEIDKKNKILKFIERPTPDQLTESYIWVNGSFYIFEPKIFDFIKLNKSIDFGKDIFPSLLAKKEPLYAFPTTGYFIDIGNLEKLEKARQTYLPKI